jgi:hypothetical protein
MKRLLGTVKDNEDSDNLRRIKATIPGIIESSISKDDLPWAFPLEGDCDVPPVDDPVWIYVEKELDGEDYNYSVQWYRRFDEITHKEAYDYTDSDSYNTKDDNKIDDKEPDLPSSTTYPKNRVFKRSNITIEFDEENKRFCITDENGNYLQFNEDYATLKAIKELKILAKEDIHVYGDGDIIKIESKNEDYIEIDTENKKTTIKSGGGHEIILDDSDSAPKVSIDSNAGNSIIMDDTSGSENILIEDKNNNTVTMDSDGMILEDKNENTVTMESSGMTLEDANDNTVEMGSSGITLEGSSGKVEIP